MATERVNAPAPERFSFRRLFRYAIGLQVVMIALVLGVTLWGTLQTRSETEGLAREARNVLMQTGQNQEFERARVALRQFVRTGDTFSLGALTQSQRQLATISIALRSSLPPYLAQDVEGLTDLQLAYLKSISSQAQREIDAGNTREARELLTSDEAVEKLRGIGGASRRVALELAARQELTERSVARRQGINALLVLLSGLLVLATGVGVLFWIRSETLVPLENLAVASRRLGHGDLSARVEPGGVQEIALTGSAFNQMAAEIEQHVGQLHELSVARSRFVSSVSHELRTPITSMRGYLELLAHGEAGSLQPDQARYVEIADRNARQLSELIDDLLTLSRVQGGNVTVKQNSIDLRQLLHQLKSEMLPFGGERGVDIVLVDTGELIVRGDEQRLRQAFGNLLSNAIKYSHEGQAVVVRALAVDRQAVVSFVDWGPGIPREDLPQIAEPFFRSEATEGVPGTGLGLPIAKQMIELHGGRLAVESEVGSGSTFTVYLPLQAGPPPVAEGGTPESAKTSGE